MNGLSFIDSIASNVNCCAGVLVVSNSNESLISVSNVIFTFVASLPAAATSFPIGVVAGVVFVGVAVALEPPPPAIATVNGLTELYPEPPLMITMLSTDAFSVAVSNALSVLSPKTVIVGAAV